jgi:hypothetical protein
MADAPTLNVWRLHPRGVRITPADPTLAGRAPLSARRYCGPYIHANGAGFYLFSPIDLDLSLDPHRPFPWEWTIHGEGYTDEDVDIVSAMPLRHPGYRPEFIRRRPKLFLSGDDNEPINTAQLWTGCIFQMPPGWSLLVRSPINRNLEAPFRVQEAVLEADWNLYDIWLNLEFIRFGVEAQIRRDGEPIAHLLPVPRQSYERWTVQERMIAPGDADAQHVFDAWIDYNFEKFHSRQDGKKEQRTYASRRGRLRDRVWHR